MNASPFTLQLRLQDAGAYTYRSYYANSSYIEGRAFELNYTAEMASRVTNIVEDLAKGKRFQKDWELANMMWRMARYDCSVGNDPAAIRWAIMARKADPSDSTNLSFAVALAEAYIEANKSNQASEILEDVSRNKIHEIDMGLARTMIHLAAFYYRSGDDDSGLVYLYKAKTLVPGNIQIDSLIGKMERYRLRKQ